jgi:hypothetical protein
MSARLYVTGLWFYTGRGGRAKLYARERKLIEAPLLVGLVLEEIEYVPEVRVARLRERCSGWRDMEAHEIKAADAYLRLVLPDEP